VLWDGDCQPTANCGQADHASPGLRCGTTAAFDAGMIGSRDQIHAAHGRTHAEHGKSIIGN